MPYQGWHPPLDVRQVGSDLLSEPLGSAKPLVLSLGGLNTVSSELPSHSNESSGSATGEVPGLPSENSRSELGDLAARFANPDAACRALKMDRNLFRLHPHALKDAAGLGGADEVLIDVPSGDVFHEDECIGNMFDG